MIKQEGNKYVLYSKDGSKKLGTFDSKKEAEEREKEIQRIKHVKSGVIYSPEYHGEIDLANIRPDITLTITKASLQEDGTMRWQAVASDTGFDKTGERTSLPLFQDWIDRAYNGKSVSYLPPPRMPFLGLSHYPGLSNELGEAGPTDKMYTDGSIFKANGVFYPDEKHPLGSLLFGAVRKEQALIKKGETVKNPIRISAAWWDISHAHGDFIFERKSLTDKCPMCESGATDKVYLRGQLDHFAATRVPINPRTSLELEQKAMTTRKEDALSIIDDPELIEEIDKQAKLTGKSEAEELPEAMVVRSDEDEPEVDKAAAKKKPKDADTEDDEEDAEMMDEEEEEEFPFDKKKKGKMADKKEKADYSPAKSDVEQMGEMMEEDEERYMPLGGAMSVKEAQSYIDAQRQANEVYSNWELLSTVMRNILTASNPSEMKGRVENALTEFSDRVAAIKAAIEDVSLIEPVTDDSPVMPEKGVIKMTSNTQQAAAQEQKAHPFEVAKSQYDEIMGNASLSREQKLQALQEQFNNLGAAVKAEIEAVAPPSVEEAITKSMAPFVDKLSLLIERMGNGQPQQQAAQPQQKSFAPAMAHQPQQPAQDAGPTPTLRKMIRRSVGIQQ